MSIDTIVLGVGNRAEPRDGVVTQTLVDLAGPLGARVILAHAFTEDQFREARKRFGLEAGTDPARVAKRHTRVQRLEDRLDEAGVDVEVRGMVGDRAEAVIGVVTESDADLLVIGGERRSPTGKAVFGSTAQELLFTASCPVVYVRDDLAEAFDSDEH